MNIMETIKQVDAAQFNATPEPNFSRQDLLKLIPRECFESSLLKSVSYFARDIAIITALYICMYYLQPKYTLPLFWFALGTMYWALFVLGHDCGHGSFAKTKWLNTFFGYLCHTPLLVPFYGWQASHKLHHSHTGSVEHEEAFPLWTESEYQSIAWIAKILRYKLFLFGFPLYLLGIRNKSSAHFIKCSHFFSNSNIFNNKNKWRVIASSLACLAAIVIYGCLAYRYGAIFITNYFVIPYIVFICWLSLVTYLQHNDPIVPLYREPTWNNLLGSLSSVDRDYKLFDIVQHNTGNAHVIHHLFLTIPHYNLKKATQAIIPMLDKYYLKSDMPIIKSFFNCFKNCHVVPDTGGKVYAKSASERLKIIK